MRVPTYGRMRACPVLLTWESGSACSPAGRPTQSSTSQGSVLGHATVSRDEADPPAGRGVARTGVTVLRVADDAFRRPVPCGGAVLNGAGELHRLHARPVSGGSSRRRSC